MWTADIIGNKQFLEKNSTALSSRAPLLEFTIQKDLLAGLEKRLARHCLSSFFHPQLPPDSSASPPPPPPKTGAFKIKTSF